MKSKKKFDSRYYMNQLQEQQQSDDTEKAHGEADNILCNILIELGLSEIVAEYEKVTKWYS